MKQPRDMTAGEVNRALDKLEAQRSKLTDQFIRDGRGNETWSETAKKTDPLALRYIKVTDEIDTLRREIEARMGPGASHRLPSGRFFGPRRY